MKKFLISTFTLLTILSLNVFAAPISMSLFQDGFSVLDKLFLIGLGITLIGILFLCIALCKSSTKKEKPIESPFDVYMEEDAQESSLSDEEVFIEDDRFESDEEDLPVDTEDVISDLSEEISTERSETIPAEPVEEPALDEIVLLEEPEEEPEESLEVSEDVPEEAPMDISEEVVEEIREEPDDIPEEKVEEIIYPKLILTNVVTNDFVILPLYPETTVGRRTENDLVLSDVTISGLHCKILNEDGLIFVVDENSTNGTFVNDERISEKTQIHHGDKLTLGKKEFNLSINE